MKVSATVRVCCLASMIIIVSRVVVNESTKQTISTTAFTLLFVLLQQIFVQRKTLRLHNLRSIVNRLTQLRVGFIHVSIHLHRSAYINRTMILGPQLSLFVIKNYFQVAFISDQYKLRIWRLRLCQLIPLGCYICERFGLREVKNQHDSITAFEVSRYYRPVALLTSSIPDIELDRLAIDLYFSDFEINGGDSGGLLCQELSLNVLPKDGSFTYIRITNHNYFVPQLCARRKISLLNHYYCRPRAIHSKQITTTIQTHNIIQNTTIYKRTTIIRTYPETVQPSL